MKIIHKLCLPGRKLIRPDVLKHECMEAAFALLTFAYIRMEKILELTFSNSLTIKILELDFTSLFNHGNNNQH